MSYERMNYAIQKIENGRKQKMSRKNALSKIES
jgi:hypothetical protein